ncbi:uncharacterized protein LDX57_007659 [Aspergillus melleus]|uniref:uncharacterized protein n=1 Tax=Aspergillus melleus TaxID=138277 RepID=UPI001E8EF29C|nr:uncharacterized protein LDX57_007659 [Aspergillus melleus]KAH8429987.1 hypothetical protein LDX57_007659 [Aspergillus melleus]
MHYFQRIRHGGQTRHPTKLILQPQGTIRSEQAWLYPCSFHFDVRLLAKDTWARKPSALPSAPEVSDLSDDVGRQVLMGLLGEPRGVYTQEKRTDTLVEREDQIRDKMPSDVLWGTNIRTKKRLYPKWPSLHPDLCK